MRFSHLNIVAAAFAAALTQGCATAADSPAGAEPEPQVLYSGQVLDESGDAVADLSVCVLDQRDDDCTTTGLDGSFLMPLAAGIPVTLSFEDRTHLPHLRAVDVGDGPEQSGEPMIVPSNAWLIGQSMTHHLVFDLTDGIVMLQLTGKPDGARLALSPGSWSLYYLNDDFDIDLSLAATSRAGIGMFVGVAPGHYEALFASPNAETTFDVEGVPGANPSTMQIEVVAGAISHGIADVDVPEMIPRPD